MQFLGINVGKFTEEENKNSSIEKFFKPCDKNTTSTQNEFSEKNSQLSKELMNSCGSLSNTTSNIKSFFLNYSKKSETETDMKDDEELKFDEVCTSENEEVDSDVDETKDGKKCKSVLEEVASTSKLDSTNLSGQAPQSDLAPCPQCETLVSIKDINEHLDLHETGETVEAAGTSKHKNISSDDCETKNPDDESELLTSSDLAACPQCGAMVSIADMSEHLDHHIAQDLHKQLNSTPLVPTREPVQPVPTSKKRKYTKMSNKNSKVAKAKGIDSFFKPL